MKTFEICRSAPAAVLFAFALLAAAGAAASPLPVMEPEPAPQPESSRAVLLVATDDQDSIAIHLPLALETAGEVLVTEQPQHGGVEMEPGAAIYIPTQYPNRRFIGRDSLRLAAGGAQLRVELLILPRFMPFAGRFDGVYQGAALWDNLEQAFQLCGEPARGEEELPCERVPVDGLGAGPFIPLAWPDAYGKESPVLFDPAASRFFHFQRRGAYFAVSEILEAPGFRGAWPILGDWSGEGRLELAMVGADGQVFQLGPRGWQPWPQAFAVAPGALSWPILLPRDGRDALALAEPESCDLHWLQLDSAAGAISDIEPSYTTGDCRRPLSWVMSPVPHLAPGLEIFFLETGGDELLLVPGKYKASKPSTIPVKFPDDPWGG